jgi:hypothetical protein
VGLSYQDDAYAPESRLTAPDVLPPNETRVGPFIRYALIEERFYTDLYVWRLFRVGGAAFFDAGRAWGGDNGDTSHAGWLGNAGVGLRIVSARPAFSNVLHIDLAVPQNAPAGIDKLQLLVKSRTSF